MIDILRGIIVQSGNDASKAIAEHMAGSEEGFAKLMNAEAARLGMTQTRFMNPTGLPDPQHKSSARDLAILARAIIRDSADYYPIYAEREFKYNGIKQGNRNALLYTDNTVDGLKTGHTDAAGYCLVATAKRDFPNLRGRRLLAIVLGAASESARAEEAQKLLNWGYTAYDGIQLFEAGQAVVTPLVYKGTAAQVGLGRAQPIVVAVPQGMAGKLKTQVTRPDPLLAPLQKNQPVAVLKVLLDQAPLVDIPLLALSEVGEAGFLGRGWDTLKLWLK